MKLTIYQIDAFTDTVFSGNPAAVCILESWLEDSLMQQIAMENNLAETAFVIPSDNSYQIRWFTPAVEVDLCGHATLAAAYILFNEFPLTQTEISFYSPRSGYLNVRQLQGGLLELDFPADELQPTEVDQSISKALGITHIEAFQGKTDYLLVFSKQEEIENMQPDMRLLKECGGRGIIVTAPGKDVDFVSRFFAPQSGIDEDPVTGSAHTTLTPYWSRRLGKSRLRAQQLSTRGGKLWCEDRETRIGIAGFAVPYLKGEIQISEKTVIT